jgi:hypothetical protein
MDKSGAGAGFLRELRFPLPIYIPSASPQSSSLSPEAAVAIASQTKYKIITNENRDVRDDLKLRNAVMSPLTCRLSSKDGA